MKTIKLDSDKADTHYNLVNAFSSNKIETVFDIDIVAVEPQTDLR